MRFDFEEFELESSKASSCDVDAMTLINSPDGSGGTFCGFKGRDRAGDRLAVAQLQVENPSNADQLQNGEAKKNQNEWGKRSL